jgi:hypothetical protein
MARRTAQLAFDMVFLDELRLKCSLVSRGLPAQIENLVAGTNLVLGRAMAVDAK